MASPTKPGSVFYTGAVRERVRRNLDTEAWAADVRQRAVDGAVPWAALSDEELWALMFGPAITRSWMVWSDGFCPACERDVRMYNWEMDPWAEPWKVRCPHCAALFPTNDFGAFYASGLDEQGVFQPERADRGLLVNASHPDKDDPMRSFGVDDGEGYVDAEGRRWRFIGAYLIYARWKRQIVDGVVALSNAYLATGGADYARKAFVLLDRVADLFPEFIFIEQGLVYEKGGQRGQVSTWHDACHEIHDLALAYDRAFEGARELAEPLCGFLSGKARADGLDNPKDSWKSIQRNIEERIFRDTLAHQDRIDSNYPTTEAAVATIMAVLHWPANKDAVLALLDQVVERGTAVDGVSGEKGLAAYATIAPRSLARLMGQFSLADPGFLRRMWEKHPALHQTYRFHIDTWCMDAWYPRVGDTGSYARKDPAYGGLALPREATLEPSTWTFLWSIHELSGDPDFARVMHLANEGGTEGIPYDVYAEDPVRLRQALEEVVAREGAEIRRASINKEQWHLALLRSGEGPHRRALWMHYDSQGRHSHRDGLNIGLFAKGLDLIPDFGYPAVGHGGWEAPKARWYTQTAAHVTVAVDGADQQAASGATTLWARGDRFHAMGAACPEMYGVKRYERVTAMLDMSERDFYAIDFFFVSGGREHTKFLHSAPGEVVTYGLDPKDMPEDGSDWLRSLQMRGFRSDPAPEPGWSADWRVQDLHGYLPEGADVHLRHTELTPSSEAILAEGWLDASASWAGEDLWIPRLAVRRTARDGTLTSTFVAVIEPYEGSGAGIKRVRRVPLETMNARALPDDFVGVEIVRAHDRMDLWFAVDARGPVEMVAPDHDVHVFGRLAMVTFNPKGVERLALCGAGWIRVGNLNVMLAPDAGFVELTPGRGGLLVAAGRADAVEYATLDDREIPVSGR